MKKISLFLILLWFQASLWTRHHEVPTFSHEEIYAEEGEKNDTPQRDAYSRVLQSSQPTRVATPVSQERIVLQEVKELEDARDDKAHLKLQNRLTTEQQRMQHADEIRQMVEGRHRVPEQVPSLEEDTSEKAPIVTADGSESTLQDPKKTIFMQRKKQYKQGVWAPFFEHVQKMQKTVTSGEVPEEPEE